MWFDGSWPPWAGTSLNADRSSLGHNKHNSRDVLLCVIYSWLLKVHNTEVTSNPVNLRLQLTLDMPNMVVTGTKLWFVIGSQSESAYGRSATRTNKQQQNNKQSWNQHIRCPLNERDASLNPIWTLNWGICSRHCPSQLFNFHWFSQVSKMITLGTKCYECIITLMWTCFKNTQLHLCAVFVLFAL